jgi:hypothetical protein
MIVRCWHFSDIPGPPYDVCSWGVERTCRASGETSVFDPMQTWPAASPSANYHRNVC